jgi:hypothetical protein
MNLVRIILRDGCHINREGDVIDWNKLRAALHPIKDFEDLSRRWREAFAYKFAREHFNYSMGAMADYTARLLGQDTRGRYDAWCADLIGLFQRLDGLGVKGVINLVEQVDSRELFEEFTARSGMKPEEVINVLKYMAYWFIPMKKPIRQLVQTDARLEAAIDHLRGVGMRSNLDLLENGVSEDARRVLAQSAGVSLAEVSELVNRADLSRMPWASAATISNIVGSGYGSIASLAAADLEQVSADFYRYGESIHKNLKFGNEIESSHRIAKIVPKVLTVPGG